jgi:hypothetical protein
MKHEAAKSALQVYEEFAAYKAKVEPVLEAAREWRLGVKRTKGGLTDETPVHPADFYISEVALADALDAFDAAQQEKDGE